MNLLKKTKNRVKGFAKTILCYWSVRKRALARAREIEASGYVLPYIEMRITTRCNMKCRKCGHFIPHYKANACDLPFEDFKVQFDNLVNCVSFIKIFSLVGGETILSKHIYEILRYVMASDKIGEIVVVSNGKMLPPEPLLQLISGTRVTMHFSQYRQNSANYPKIRALGIKYNIKMKFYGGSGTQIWYDYGDIKPHWRFHCYQTILASGCFFGTAKQYCNGILFLCPRINNAWELGMLHLPDKELLRITDNVEESRKNILKFYSMPYSSGCKFCSSNSYIIIPAAEQL